MPPSPEAIAAVAERSAEEINDAAQDSLQRVLFTLDLFALANVLPDDVAQGLRQRISVASGALNVLAERAS